MRGAAARLAVLRDLARLKADRETARLAAVARSRARLRAALEGLGPAEPPLGDAAWIGGSRADRRPGGGLPDGGSGQRDGGMGPDGEAPGGAGPPLALPDTAPGGAAPAFLIRARLAHAAWIAAQRAQILARLALVESDWHRLLPPAARAFGQATVLDTLTRAARQADRAKQPATAEGTGPRRPAAGAP